MSSVVTALMLLNIASVSFFGNLKFAMPIDPSNPILIPIPYYFPVSVSASLTQNVETFSVQLYSNQMGQITGRNNAEALETIYLAVNLQTQQLEFVGTNLGPSPPDYAYKFSYQAFVSASEVSYSWRKTTNAIEVMCIKTVFPIVE